MRVPFSLLAGAGAGAEEGTNSFKTSDDVGGPTYAFTDISGTGTRITAMDGSDDDQAEIVMSGDWSFPFFGVDYTHFWVTTNGYLAMTERFNNDVVYNEEEAFPNILYLNQPVLGVFGKDLTNTNGIFWKEDADHLTVQWDSAEILDATGSNITFQVIVWDTGVVQYVYETMTDGDSDLLASVGLQQDAIHNGVTVSDGTDLIIESNFMIEFTLGAPPGTFTDLSGFLTSDDVGGPTFAFTDLGDGSPEGLTWPGGSPFDDDQATLDAFDFGFPFFGVIYTHFFVGINGNVFLWNDAGNDTRDNELTAFPAAAYGAGPMLSPFGKNLKLVTGVTDVWWQEFGDHLTIQWNDIDVTGFPGCHFTFQCILWMDGKVQYVYSTMTTAGGQTLAAAIGLQEDDTTNGLTVSDGSGVVVETDFMIEFT